MQLKKRGAGACTHLAQHGSHMQPTGTELQLLNELESLTGGSEATQDHCGGGFAVVGCSSMPAVDGTASKSRFSNGVTSTAKRRRRTQLVSIFGSQDETENVQQEHMPASEALCAQQDPLNELPGPSWPQQKASGLGHAGNSKLAVSAANSIDPCDRRSSTVTGIRLGSGTAPADTLQAGDLQGLHVRQQQTLPEEEDAISDSDIEYEHTTATAARPRYAYKTHLTSPTGLRQQQRQPHDQQQQHIGHVPGSRATTSLQLSPPHLLQQQHCRSLLDPAAASSGAALQQPVTNKTQTVAARHNAAEQDVGDWMPPKHRRLQQQQQQQLVTHVKLPLSATKPAVKRLSASLTAAAGGCSPAVALGPGRPAAVGSADQLAAAVPPLHRAPLVPAAATADAGGDGSAVQPQDQPWWMVLEDFVPVEVLVTEAMNPRDGAVVHINYKSQFKDGGAAGKRDSTAAAGGTTTKRKKGGAGTGAKGIRAAAAAAAGGASGFVTAGVYAAAGGGSGARGKKGRKGKRSGGSTGSGKDRGSGARRKKSGGSGGKWRFRNGRKVFIDGSGKQLTGSAAWGRYQQDRG